MIKTPNLRVLLSDNEVKGRQVNWLEQCKQLKIEEAYLDILLIVFQEPCTKCLFLELEDEEDLNNESTVMTTKESLLFYASLLAVAFLAKQVLFM